MLDCLPVYGVSGDELYARQPDRLSLADSIDSLRYEQAPERSSRVTVQATWQSIESNNRSLHLEISLLVLRAWRCNIKLICLIGRTAPDVKTIADFRKNNGEAIRLVCREFEMVCKKLNLLTDAFVAIWRCKLRK